MKQDNFSCQFPAQNLKLFSVFFGGTELEDGFKKRKNFTTYLLKAFSSDTPQSTERQKKGPKEHDENIYPVLDQNRPIRKTQAQDQYR